VHSAQRLLAITGFHPDRHGTHHSIRSRGHTPSATAAPVPPGPFAVVVTNDQRTGTTYEVMLINDEAQIVAHATAAPPALQPNQTLRNLPLVSVSDTKVYYLNGNTDVDALSPAGTTATATQIPDGTSKEIAFAVVPENQMIAISEISEESDATTDAGEGYIQDLSNPRQLRPERQVHGGDRKHRGGGLDGDINHLHPVPDQRGLWEHRAVQLLPLPRRLAGGLHRRLQQRAGTAEQRWDHHQHRPRVQSILGWIDATHLLVEVDSGDLGVLDPDTGVLTSVAVAQANEVSMVATLPGSL
jgi:hypothetical protein